MALHVAQSIPLKLHGMVLHRLLQAGPLINRSKRLVKKPAAKRSVAEDVPKGVVPAQLKQAAASGAAEDSTSCGRVTGSSFSRTSMSGPVRRVLAASAVQMPS